jgi:hypothetical protein
VWAAAAGELLEVPAREPLVGAAATGAEGRKFGDLGTGGSVRVGLVVVVAVSHGSSGAGFKSEGAWALHRTQ